MIAMQLIDQTVTMLMMFVQIFGIAAHNWRMLGTVTVHIMMYWTYGRTI